jgi:hypothetical protein
MKTAIFTNATHFVAYAPKNERQMKSQSGAKISEVTSDNDFQQYNVLPGSSILNTPLSNMFNPSPNP